MATFLKLFSNLIKTRCQLQVVTRKYSSSISRDLMGEKSKDALSTQGNFDILMGNLKTTRSTEDVLNIVKAHNSVMNEKHLVQALRSLFSLQKSGSTNLSMKQILKQSEFELLCQQLRKHAGKIELNDTIEALKVINFLGVSSDSTIVQVLLQLIKHQINLLSLHQIIFIDFLLSHMKETPLTEALLIALPIVFEIQLPYKLDRSNLEHINECLRFVSKKNVNPATFDYLIKAIEGVRENVNERTALGLIWSICDLPPKGFFEPTIKRLIDVLIVHIDSLTISEIDTTISKLCSKFSSNFQFYYSDVFFDTCINYMIDEDKGFLTAMHCAKKCARVGHENNLLTEYMCNKIVENPSLVFNDSTASYNVINYLALTDYTPNKWLELKQILTSVNCFKNCYRKEIYWSRLLASLFILDIDKPEVLDEVFKGNYLHKIMKLGIVFDIENMTIIKQAITLFKPEYLHLLEQRNTIIKTILKPTRVEMFPLEGALKVALGGENYVKTNLTTELNHAIDHMFVLRKGGFPVSINMSDEIKKIEDIDVGLYNQIVVVLGLTPNHYTRNTERLKACTLFTIKTLETQGYVVVPISLSSWLDLEDYEKIPYLMNAIKEKTGKEEFAYKL